MLLMPRKAIVLATLETEQTIPISLSFLAILEAPYIPPEAEYMLMI